MGPLGVAIPLPRRAARKRFAQIAQLVEQGTENPRVAGSIPALGTTCGHSSSGRAPPCQGGGSEFEPRRPLQTNSKEPVYAGFLLIMVTWPSGKARVCKTLIHQFKSGRHLQKIPGSFGFRDFFVLRCSLSASSPSPSPTVTDSPGAGEVFPQRESLWRNRSLCS